MVFAPLKKKYIGDILVAQGKISQGQLKYAHSEQKTGNKPIEEILLELKYINENDLMRARAFQSGLIYNDLSKINIDDQIRRIIPIEMVRKYRVIPIAKEGKVLIVAMEDPSNVVVIDEIKSETKLKVSVVLSSGKSIDNAIEKFFGALAVGFIDYDDDIGEKIEEGKRETPEDSEDLSESEKYEAADAPIVRYVNSIVREAIQKNASDIHLDPMEKMVSLRFRIDGSLRDFPGPSKTAYSAISSRLKIMANLDIAEKRLPQDGKFRMKVYGRKVDVRVAVLPTIHGEKIVLRILRNSNVTPNLSDLGFTKDDLLLHETH